MFINGKNGERMREDGDVVFFLKFCIRIKLTCIAINLYIYLCFEIEYSLYK